MPATPDIDSRTATDWPAVLAIFVAGLAAAMHFAKVAPVMEAVGHDLGLSLVESGLAVSVLGIVGVVFAIAAGRAAPALGLARGLLGALFIGALIAAAGAVAPGAGLFLLSRVLEGFSHLLIVITGPALMALHASRQDRPLVLALWSCFFGTGYAITAFAAPAIVSLWTWRGLLAAHALVMAAAGLWVWIALRRSGYRDGRQEWPGLRPLAKAHVDVFLSGVPLLLALAFCAYTILYLAVLTFLAKFLTEALGWPITNAGSFMAAITLVSLVFSLLSGVLIKAGVGLLTALITAFAGLALTALGIFGLGAEGHAMTLMAVIMMACFGLLPGLVFATVPRVATSAALAALTYGAIALFGNVGTFLGTPVFALFYGAAGWPGGAAFIVIMSLTGIGLSVILSRQIEKAP